MSAPLLASLISIGVGGLVHGVLGQLADWVSAGAEQILRGLAAAVAATTAAPLNQEFVAVYGLVRDDGAAMAGTFLMLALLRAVIRQDFGDLWRLLLLRLPLALLGAGIALQLVELAVQASDALSSSLLGADSTSGGGSLPGSIAGLLGNASSSAAGSFELLVLAVLTALAGFVLWFELVIRSSAIAIATLFIPLALAGAIWSSTLGWARRLAEMLAALIFSKVVIVGVFALALVELGTSSGLDGLVQGTALLLLATFSPWTLLRLVPVVEAGAVSHLEGLTSRAARAAGRLAGAGLDAVDGSESDFVPTPTPTIPLAEGMSYDTPEFRELVSEFEERYLAAAAAQAGGSEREDGDGSEEGPGG